MKICKLRYIDECINTLINKIDLKKLYNIYDKYDVGLYIENLIISKNLISLKELNNKLFYFKINKNYNIYIQNQENESFYVVWFLFPQESHKYTLMEWSRMLERYPESFNSYKDYLLLCKNLEKYVNVDFKTIYCPQDNMDNLNKDLQKLGLDFSYIKTINVR